MNPSVHLVEAALGYLERRDYDAYLALLSPDVRVGINETLPVVRDLAEIRRLITQDQVVGYWVDEVVVGPSVRVKVDVLLHYYHDAHIRDTWMPSVYWVRAGRIERVQLAFRFEAGHASFIQGGFPRLHTAQRLRRLLGG